MVLYFVLWPIGLLLQAFFIWGEFKQIQESGHIDPVIFFQLWVLYFIIRMPMFVRKAIKVHSVEMFMMCCKPGKMLQIVQTSDTTSDIIFDEEFITTRWGKRVLNVVGRNHVRRSVDMTITNAMSSGAYRPISGDDVVSPKYFLTGTGDDSVEEYDELWTSHASMASWPSLYAWSPSLGLLRTSIPLGDETTVLGYIHLLETSDPIAPERITTRFAPCMGSSPCFMREDQVIARRWYWTKNQFGNFPRGLPDAYIFRKGSSSELGLKAVHSFRLCIPAADAQV